MTERAPLPDRWTEFAQESERARSLGHRGLLVTGTSSVSVAVLLQALGVLVAGTSAFPSSAKFALLIALFCFVVAAISGVLTNVAGPAATSGDYRTGEAIPEAALNAARMVNDRNTRALGFGAALEGVGMVFVFVTAWLLVFK